MKTVTTREVQHHFAKVLALVGEGESVQVKRRGEVVAVISPPQPDLAEREVDWGTILKEQSEWMQGIPVQEINPVLVERESYDR